MPTPHVNPSLLPFLFEDIDWCDQSASPPAKASDTHALQFNFYQDADDPEHPHVYRGLLLYTPPSPAGSLLSRGSFTGTGCLVAQRHACEQIVSGLSPFPWVRIGMSLRHTGGAGDPLDPNFRLTITGSLTYLAATSIPGFPNLELTGGPGIVQQTFETDFDYAIAPSGGELPNNPPHLALVDPPGGKIFYSRTTVVP